MAKSIDWESRIGRRVRQLGLDRAVGPGLVIDQHGLAKYLGEWLRHDTDNSISRRAGGERHEKADRFGGILRCARWRNKQSCYREQTGEFSQSVITISPIEYHRRIHIHKKPTQERKKRNHQENQKL